MMTSNKRRRVPTIFADASRNPGFAAGAFGLSAWAYVGMSHTIADYEGPGLGYGLGIAYEALVIGMAWEGRRRADQALDAGRAIKGHRRWLVGAIGVGILSGTLAAWHGWSRGEGVFALSRAVAPILAAVAVHLFFQSAASARDLERKAQIQEREVQTRRDQEGAVLDMLDAVRQAKIAPAGDHARHIGAVNDAVTRVHRNVPADVTATVTGPHLESERVIHDVIREAADLAGAWMPEPDGPAPIETTDHPSVPTPHTMIGTGSNVELLNPGAHTVSGEFETSSPAELEMSPATHDVEEDAEEVQDFTTEQRSPVHAATSAAGGLRMTVTERTPPAENLGWTTREERDELAWTIWRTERDEKTGKQLTHQQVADQIGTSKATVTRAIEMRRGRLESEEIPAEASAVSPVAHDEDDTAEWPARVMV